MGAKTAEELRAMGLTPPDENEAQAEAAARLEHDLEHDRALLNTSFVTGDGKRIDPKDVVPIHEDQKTFPSQPQPALNGRVQLWLAPFTAYLPGAFEALVAAFEDDQVEDKFQHVAAHLLTAMGSALDRMDEVHPAILEMTRADAKHMTGPDITGRVGTSAPDFSGGPLYTFDGATPADKPDPFLWQVAEVRGVDESEPPRSVTLYKHRENRAGGPIVGVADKRFTVYIGRTVKA